MPRALFSPLNIFEWRPYRPFFLFSIFLFHFFGANILLLLPSFTSGLAFDRRTISWKLLAKEKKGLT
jgi:hypothetical protein